MTLQLPRAEGILSDLLKDSRLTEEEKGSLGLVLTTYFNIVECDREEFAVQRRKLKTCIECGTEFYVGSSKLYRRRDAETCSEECGRKVYRRRQAERNRLRRQAADGLV